MVSIIAYNYFGTDATYLQYVSRFVRTHGQLGVVITGLVEELPAPLAHYTKLWHAHFGILHTPNWWQHHLELTRGVNVTIAELVPGGWERWAEWYELAVARERPIVAINRAEAAMMRADEGKTLGLVRLVVDLRA